jgi:hypothetical protein
MLSQRLCGVITAVLLSGVGAALPTGAAAQQRSHSVAGHPVLPPVRPPAPPLVHDGMPQHGAGDHDADTPGGPSDRDGTV